MNYFVTSIISYRFRQVFVYFLQKNLFLDSFFLLIMIDTSFLTIVFHRSVIFPVFLRNSFDFILHFHNIQTLQKNNMNESLITHSLEVAKILKTIAHPSRLILLCHLSRGESTVGELESICQETSQSQLSQWLARLREEGVVDMRRDGHFVYYRISDPRISELLRSLESIFCPMSR